VDVVESAVQVDIRSRDVHGRAAGASACSKRPVVPLNARVYREMHS